jgi:hypothetical protein
MKLDPTSVQKADAKLREILQTAGEGTSVRVVIILEATSDKKGRTQTRPDLRPADFPSVSEYRHELIQRRKDELKESVGDTLEQLRRLSLQITGGEIGRAIVAEGSIEQIAKALEIPGVASVMLDQPIELVMPRRGKDE